ncbi:MAG: hypothetical protein COA78_21115 [Blastopirellula sp.]|nr:MAG: hypothetical protein COA78_21115 [Blastopirellula sp.]
MNPQSLRSYPDIKQNVGNATDRFVQDYSAVKENLAAALRLIEELKPLSGAQTPEGNVTANLSQTFIDTTASPVSVTMYFNETVGSNTGWVVVV